MADDEVPQEAEATFETVQASLGKLMRVRRQDEERLALALRDSEDIATLVARLNSKLNKVLDVVHLETDGRPLVPPRQASAVVGKVDKKRASRANTSEAEVLLAGWLNKKGRNVRNWKRRFFILKGGMLTYYSDESCTNLKGTIPLDKCVVDGLRQRENTSRPCLSLVHDDRTLYFQADTRRENMAWFLAINCMQHQLQYAKKIGAKGQETDRRILDFFKRPMRHELALDGLPIPMEAAVALVSSIRFHTVMHTLSLQNASLEDDQIEVFAKCFARNRSLSVVRLSSNFITPVGASHLAAGLKSNQTITEVYLEDNNLGDAGVENLIECLADHPMLSVLALDGNKITDEGILLYAETLGDLSYKMGTLNLAHNEIGDEGVTSVVALLEENPHVTHIDLGHNSISDDGVRALVESLRTSTTLKKVSLTGNAYTADVRGELGKALVINGALEHLDMSPSVLEGSGLEMMRFLHGVDFLGSDGGGGET